MSISVHIKEMLTRGSWIRRMFEIGRSLKAEHGAENVYDFSIGNPDVPPPAEFQQALMEEAARTDPMIHTYMHNGGYMDAREGVAKQYRDKTGVDVAAEDIILTSGAGGALNVFFKSVLEPDDEVLVLFPFFVEYAFYIPNHGGRMIPVETTPDFLPDMEAIEAAINGRTRGIIINSPNNPTGRMYPEETIRSLAALLKRKSEEHGRTIYLVSDEPYREIVFDGRIYPSPLVAYDNTVIATSHSKDLSLAGERIGHLVISPNCEAREDLHAATVFCNRILGFINANALMQRVITRIPGVHVDPMIYQQRRDVLCDGLREIGYEFHKPEGTFYLFPRSPIDDDAEFTQMLMKELIIATPGKGFGRGGHFRLSFAVEDRVIKAAMPGFKKAYDRAVG